MINIWIMMADMMIGVSLFRMMIQEEARTTRRKKKEYFEMNALHSDETLDLNEENYRQNSGASDLRSASEKPEKAGSFGKTERSMKKKHALLVILALTTVLAVGSVVISLLIRDDNEIDTMYDVKGTVFVTESDSPGIDQISEDVIGTGMLFENSDIYEAAEKSSLVVGRLSAGSDVMIYASEGDYYRISDPEKKVVRYVLKERVNTGGLDLGNPDAPYEIIDDDTGDVISSEMPVPPTAGSGVNPEDFPVNNSPYFIYVEKGSHTITIFGKDSDG